MPFNNAPFWEVSWVLPQVNANCQILAFVHVAITLLTAAFGHVIAGRHMISWIGMHLSVPHDGRRYAASGLPISIETATQGFGAFVRSAATALKFQGALQLADWSQAQLALPGLCTYQAFCTAVLLQLPLGPFACGSQTSTAFTWKPTDLGALQVSLLIHAGGRTWKRQDGQEKGQTRRKCCRQHWTHTKEIRRWKLRANCVCIDYTSRKHHPYNFTISSRATASENAGALIVSLQWRPHLLSTDTMHQRVGKHHSVSLQPTSYTPITLLFLIILTKLFVFLLLVCFWPLVMALPSFLGDIHRCVAVSLCRCVARPGHGDQRAWLLPALRPHGCRFSSAWSALWVPGAVFWPRQAATSTSHVDSSGNPGISVGGVVGNLKICMLVQTT